MGKGKREHIKRWNAERFDRLAPNAARSVCRRMGRRRAHANAPRKGHRRPLGLGGRARRRVVVEALDRAQDGDDEEHLALHEAAGEELLRRHARLDAQVRAHELEGGLAEGGVVQRKEGEALRSGELRRKEAQQRVSHFLSVSPSVTTQRLSARASEMPCSPVFAAVRTFSATRRATKGL